MWNLEHRSGRAAKKRLPQAHCTLNALPEIHMLDFGTHGFLVCLDTAGVGKPRSNRQGTPPEQLAAVHYSTPF